VREADTPTLLRLNDQAKLLNLNRWCKVWLFGNIAPDGVHVLAYAIPHGIRPASSSEAANAPQHYRTAWYVQMADGSDKIAALDVTVEDYDDLRVIDGTDDSLVGDLGDGRFELPAVVVLERHVIDGHAVVKAAELVRPGAIVSALELDPLPPERLAGIRESPS
jgi:hypothetical protein